KKAWSPSSHFDSRAILRKRAAPGGETMRMIKPTALVTLGLLTLAATGRAEDPTERRLRQLEEQLRKTQAEIQQLRDQLQQQRAIGQATQKQVEQTAEESKTAAAETKKGLELPDWAKRTTLFGDMRARHEGFYHQPHKNGQIVNARNR